jgi:hypothetical protein
MRNYAKARKVVGEGWKADEYTEKCFGCYSWTRMGVGMLIEGMKKSVKLIGD